MRISSYMAEISYLKGRINDLENGSSPKSPRRTETGYDRLCELEARISGSPIVTKSQTNSPLTSPIPRLPDKDLRIHELESEVCRLQEKNSELTAYANTLKAEFERYRGIVNAKLKAKNEEIRTLQAQLDQATQVIVSRERISKGQARDELDRRYAIDELTHENNQLRKRNDVLRRQLATGSSFGSSSSDVLGSDSSALRLVRELKDGNRALRENLNQLSHSTEVMVTPENIDEFYSIRSPVKKPGPIGDEDRLSTGSASSNQEDEHLSQAIQDLRQQIGKMMDDRTSESEELEE